MAEGETHPWIGRFDDLDPEDRSAVAQLVVDGGAVFGTRRQIAARLATARILVLLLETGSGRIVGVASLKTPNSLYRRSKFDDAGVGIEGYEDAPELGYVVVAKDMQGKKLSGRLVDLILREIRAATFATTDNEIMKKNLTRAGFQRVGREWQGQKGSLSLWTFVPR